MVLLVLSIPLQLIWNIDNCSKQRNSPAFFEIINYYIKLNNNNNDDELKEWEKKTAAILPAMKYIAPS